MDYKNIEEGMALKADNKIYLVVATDFKVNNPLDQSISLYDTEHHLLVYPAIFEIIHRNRLWCNTGDIQAIYPKDKVIVSIG